MRNRIALYMAARGLTAEKLKDRANLAMHRTVLSGIINGHYLPTALDLMSICEALNAAPVELYDSRDINLLRVQELWEQRHGQAKAWQGYPEVRTRLKPYEKDRLDYILRQRQQTFGEWMRDVLWSEYEVPRADGLQQAGNRQTA